MAERRVSKLVRGQEVSEGAGVKLTRVMGTREFDHLDPFLLLDEFKSDRPDDYIAGCPDHPHRGFETVTYMLAGSMRHEDHVGNRGELGPGSVQWMTAGRGIIHSEMPQQDDGLLWGFQLWVNLPARAKLAMPRYQDIPSEKIPEVALGQGARARVIAGEANGTRGPVDGIVTAPLYLDVTIAPNSDVSIDVPSGHNAFAYVYAGRATFGGSAPVGRDVDVGQLAVFTDGDEVYVSTDDLAARFLLLAARPLREPIVRYGPFVMNSRDEIVKAVQDFQRGTLLG